MWNREPYPESPSWSRRAAAASVVIAAHLALLISFQTRSPPPVARPASGQGGVSLSIVAWAAPGPAPQASVSPATPPPPPPPPDPATPELIEHPEDLGLPAPRTDLEPMPVNDNRPASASMAGVAAPADPCHFTQALQTALQGDETVRHALTLIPRDAKSVANAIMVWNGQWVAVNALDGDASFDPVRAAIVEGLRASSTDCLARVNNGPLFITIAGWPETTVLALGSGQWRASDLIAQRAGAVAPPTVTAPRG